MAAFRFEKRRREWLLGRWSAKQLLTGADFPRSPVQMDDCQIDNEQSGVPFATDLNGNRLPGCLTISHRENAAFCAYCPDSGARFGADLEWIEPKDLDFFQDYLTSTEVSQVLSLPFEVRDLAILLIWSGKEAALKALGTGLRLDTRKIEVGSFQWIWEKTFVEDEWYEFSLSSRMDSTLFQGRWMVHHGFVVTLASIGIAPMNIRPVSISGQSY